MTGYLLPVGDVPVSDDWQDHRDRRPPSTEPGTDYACAYGTPVLAPADGFVVGVKRSTSGGSGRALMINTSGDYHRALHLSSIPLLMVPGRRFRSGDVLAKSGASANGSDWGTGVHVHWSFWRAPGRVPTPGVTPTQDFELYTAGEAPAGGGAPFPTIPSTPTEDEMTPEQAAQLQAVYAAIFGVRNVNGKDEPIKWLNYGGAQQESRYGALPIVIENQVRIGKVAGQVSALTELVRQLGGGSGTVDMAAIEAAAEKGAREALEDLQITIGTGAS